jgi:hypothetical protein
LAPAGCECHNRQATGIARVYGRQNAQALAHTRMVTSTRSGAPSTPQYQHAATGREPGGGAGPMTPTLHPARSKPHADESTRAKCASGRGLQIRPMVTPAQRDQPVPLGRENETRQRTRRSSLSCRHAQTPLIAWSRSAQGRPEDVGRTANSDERTFRARAHRRRYWRCRKKAGISRSSSLNERTGKSSVFLARAE